MKVIFNGILEKKKRGGCNCSGKSKSTLRMLTSKTFILPSGVTRTFHAGQETEVEEEDGRFLLEYQYTENGEKKPVFTVV